MSETTRVNKFNLPRYIPEDVRREVRQRDGFGCIFCALPIIQYEHVDPVYVEARSHTVEGITLLCPTCHQKVTGGQISKNMVKKQMLTPKAKSEGIVKDLLYFCDEHPTVILGGSTFVECDVPVSVLGHDIISIEKEDNHFLLNAQIWDSQGRQTLKIVKNEWQCDHDSVWDLTTVGNTITIREGKGLPTLTIKIEENKRFIIEKFNMQISGKTCRGTSATVTLSGNEKELRATGYKNEIVGKSLYMENCGIGLMLW
ncbi:HNH endonuclease [Nissabacter sp. SGAir0207]|uniref:HNH endonuclease n=1 Tax=Nissabacter sp. SGAir0207 TaxID=2126321 RepID=UPI0010F82940|nr:HNH endonuclease [Nissabacter sp. SGAir0207]